MSYNGVTKMHNILWLLCYWLVAYRTVETVVNLSTSVSWLTDCECVIVLRESLSSGLYVDSYQTDNLHQHGAAKVSRVLLFITRETQHTENCISDVIIF